jgi:hypothetical protein
VTATKKTENRMKIKVRVQHGANNTPMYVSTEPNRRGVYKAYTEAQYKAERYQFEIVKEAAKPSGRVVVGEVTPVMPKLPKPLGELNELVALLTVTRPNTSREKIVAAAERMIADKKAYLRQREVKESWQRRGLTPEAAEVAAKVELSKRPADLPPATEWASLLDKAFGGK